MDERYFEWIVRLVCGDNARKRRRYRKLLAYLHERPFIYSLEMDENRARDGIDLRYRYTSEIGTYDISRSDQPCSVLEMMAALAIRCEEHIMSNPDVGDRTSEWFFAMIESIGLTGEVDSVFNIRHVEMHIDRLLHREYEPDGRGGLFTVPNCRHDMRDIEIWYQAMWYLGSY